MRMVGRFGWEVIFDKEGPVPFQSVLKTLQSACDFVRDVVITPLSKFL
jgi:hypothetical protein